MKLSLPLLTYLKLRLFRPAPVLLTYNRWPYYARLADSVAVAEIVFGGEYTFLDPLWKMQPIARVADLGANIGLFSLYCFQNQPDVAVLSVEPDPGTFAVLKKTAERHSSLKWSVVRAAAHARDGTVSFGPACSSAASRVDRQGQLQVPSLSLRSLEKLLGDGVVDLMKVDIEGAEEALISHSTDPFARVLSLVIELHPDLCDTEPVLRAVKARFRHVSRVEGRNSKKPLLFCADVDVFHPALKPLG